MALSLQEQFDLGNEKTFENLVAMSMAGYADDVMAEDQSALTDVDANGTTEAEARTSFAVQVVIDAPRMADRRKWWLAAQAAALTWPPGDTAAEFAASISDATYNSFISGNWSVLAGCTTSISILAGNRMLV